MLQPQDIKLVFVCLLAVVLLLRPLLLRVSDVRFICLVRFVTSEILAASAPVCVSEVQSLWRSAVNSLFKLYCDPVISRVGSM